MGHFTPDQLRNIKTVITHGNCPDGTASAMIIADAFSGAAIPVPEIREIIHQTPEKLNLPAAPGMLFVDISPEPGPRVREFLDAGALCLDHHAKGSSVKEFVEAGLGVYGNEATEPGVCGAVLAYEHVWKTLRDDNSVGGIEDFSRLAGIRDTWQKQSPDWIAACEQAEGLRFWTLDKLAQVPADQWAGRLDEIGKHLWQKKQKTATKVAERVYPWTTPRGTKVAIFQGTKLSSDVSETLGSAFDLVVAFDILYENDEFKLLLSTRSRGTFDCGSMAVAHGGGGHTRAAGFNVKMGITSPNPYHLVQLTVAAHEACLPPATTT